MVKEQEEVTATTGQLLVRAAKLEALVALRYTEHFRPQRGTLLSPAAAVQAAEASSASLRSEEAEVAAEVPVQTPLPVPRVECPAVLQDGPVIIITGQEAPEVKEKLRPAMAALLNGVAEEGVGLAEETQTAEIHVMVEAGAGVAGGLRQAMCKVECQEAEDSQVSSDRWVTLQRQQTNTQLEQMVRTAETERMVIVTS